jgi:UrcA family protein
MSKFVLAAAAALAMACPALARADDQAPPAQSLSTQGVNFADQADAGRFYAKLQQAANDVCFLGAGVTRMAEVDQTCVREAMVQAVQQVNAPVLTALYERGGGDLNDARVYPAAAR